MFESGGRAERGTKNSGLRERLRAALAQPMRSGPLPRAESVTELADLSLLGGRWYQSERGPGYVIESVYEAGHEHGEVALHRALGVDTARLGEQCRDPRLAAVAPRDWLYVDTETTGLGGAGAMVFLAGVARFDGSLLRLRQYLLPSPAYEAGLLGGLGRDLAIAGALVSYNGKSFDVPMLESRYVLSRMRCDLRAVPHLDLLHPNRRLFRGAVASHRLVEIEAGLLGFERQADCPSREVPERYFRFQRTGDPTWLRPVLRHNAWDVLSLVALVAHLAAVCEGGAHPVQAARAALYAGNLAAATDYYQAALGGQLARAERLEALERLALCCRRLGRFEEAAGWWREMLAEPHSRRLRPYVELAKHAEHRARDRKAALALVSEALCLVRRGQARPGPAGSETGVTALERRLARLAR